MNPIASDYASRLVMELIKLQLKHAEQAPLLGALRVRWVRKAFSSNSRNTTHILMVPAIYFGYFFKKLTRCWDALCLSSLF